MHLETHLSGACRGAEKNWFFTSESDWIEIDLDIIKTRDCECRTSPSREGSDRKKLTISSRLRLGGRNMNFLIALSWNVSTSLREVKTFCST